MKPSKSEVKHSRFVDKDIDITVRYADEMSSNMNTPIKQKAHNSNASPTRLYDSSSYKCISLKEYIDTAFSTAFWPAQRSLSLDTLHQTAFRPVRRSKSYGSAFSTAILPAQRSLSHEILHQTDFRPARRSLSADSIHLTDLDRYLPTYPVHFSSISSFDCEDIHISPDSSYLSTWSLAPESDQPNRWSQPSESKLTLEPSENDTETTVKKTEICSKDTNFVGLISQLTMPNTEDGASSSISAYIKQVGLHSEKAKALLEWLYLNDESLKVADKVCIGYGVEFPEEPVYLALYSNFAPEATCSFLYNTFKVIHRTVGCVSDEGKVISEMEMKQKLEFSEAEQKRLHACLSKNTTILMKEHSNLMMVGASKLKSEGYGTTNPKVYENTCIVLYVEVKGFVPMGEKHFPTQIDDEFPIDVREGIFKTFSDPKEFHQSLVMGCQIVTSYNTCGTLGAFVPLQDGYIGCLTCCHVFETKDSVVDYKKDPDSLCYFKTDVYQPEPTCEYKFGDSIKFIQNPGDENNIGVDAALIVLNVPQRYPKGGDFPTINCAIAGFSQEKPMIFNSGEIIECFEDIKLPCHVVKYGATTGLTIGHLRSYGTAIQVFMPSFHPDDKIYLHQQFEVLKIGVLPFAEEGDSGALVFCVCNNGKTTELKAMGLLVGGATNGNVIVTPIWAILNKLKLPLKLFCFDDSRRKPNAPATDNQRLLKIEADVDGLKSRLDAISASMARKEDIDRIIQLLQQTNSPSASRSDDSMMITDN